MTSPYPIRRFSWSRSLRDYSVKPKDVDKKKSGVTIATKNTPALDPAVSARGAASSQGVPPSSLSVGPFSVRGGVLDPLPPAGRQRGTKRRSSSAPLRFLKNKSALRPLSETGKGILPGGQFTYVYSWESSLFDFSFDPERAFFKFFYWMRPVPYPFLDCTIRKN